MIVQSNPKCFRLTRLTRASQVWEIRVIIRRIMDTCQAHCLARRVGATFLSRPPVVWVDSASSVVLAVVALVPPTIHLAAYTRRLQSHPRFSRGTLVAW